MFIITILCPWFMLVGSHIGSNKHLHQDLLNLHSTMDGSLLLSPRLTRARSKPNLSVSEVQYKEALHALLVADPPMLDMNAKLGPELAYTQKQVTPGHLVSLEKLWYKLISSGCKQLVLQSQKIRSALHFLVSEAREGLDTNTMPERHVRLQIAFSLGRSIWPLPKWLRADSMQNEQTDGQTDKQARWIHWCEMTRLLFWRKLK